MKRGAFLLLLLFAASAVFGQSESYRSEEGAASDQRTPTNE